MGLVALYSSSQPLTVAGKGGNYFLSQLKWVVIGLGVMLFIIYLPNRVIHDLSYILYGISIVFLVMVILWGSEGYGATRWLRLGSMGFQPSEFAKIATLLAVSRYLSDERLDINQFKVFAIASSIVLLPFVLIAKQPDLGTSLVFGVMTLPIFYWAGLRTENLILILAPVLILFASLPQIY